MYESYGTVKRVFDLPFCSQDIQKQFSYCCLQEIYTMEKNPAVAVRSKLEFYVYCQHHFW